MKYIFSFCYSDVVMYLIKSEFWKKVMSNAYIDPNTGLRETPMRKLIRKMPGRFLNTAQYTLLCHSWSDSGPLTLARVSGLLDVVNAIVVIGLLMSSYRSLVGSCRTDLQYYSGILALEVLSDGFLSVWS